MENIGQVEDTMNKLTKLALSATGLLTIALSATMAQTAPPTFQGDPDVYKVIFEDQNFRVIDAVRKAGVHDKAHGHPVPSVVYNVTDCSGKTYTPDGKSTEIAAKAGSVRAVPVIASHSAENVSTTDCHQIFFERK